MPWTTPSSLLSVPCTLQSLHSSTQTLSVSIWRSSAARCEWWWRGSSRSSTRTQHQMRAQFPTEGAGAQQRDEGEQRRPPSPFVCPPFAAFLVGGGLQKKNAAPHHPAPVFVLALVHIAPSPSLSRLIALPGSLCPSRGAAWHTEHANMSTRQLVHPSTVLDTSCFRLQAPPHQYNRDKRKGRILPQNVLGSTGGLGQQASTDNHAATLAVKNEMRGRKRANSATSAFEPLLGETAEVDDAEEGASTVTDELKQSQRLLCDNVQLDPLADEGSCHAVLLTSPVKDSVRNIAFFGDTIIWSTSDGEMQTPRSACSSSFSMSTTSFHGLARSTFGLGFRRRGSQQSSQSALISPTQYGRYEDARIEQSDNDHTILLLSPRTPLTPRRSAAPHTPSRPRLDVVNTRLIVPSGNHDSEPLSATLKRLGAARKSVQVQDEDRSADSTNTKSGLSTAPTTNEGLEARLDNFMRAKEARKANHAALQLAEGLFSSRRSKNSIYYDARPRMEPSLKVCSGPAYTRIESTTRAGQHRSMRATVSHISAVLAGYVFGNLHKPKEPNESDDSESESVALTATTEDILHRPEPVAPKQRADGWGGMRPRSSWFPNLRAGPLISPPPTASSRHLRALQLQSFPRCNNEDEAWVDQDEEPGKEPNSPRREQDMPIKTLRVKFPSYLPHPRRDLRETPASLSDNGADEAITVVKFTNRSVEGRPSTRYFSLRRLHSSGGLFLAFVILLSMVAALAIIVTAVLSQEH